MIEVYGVTIFLVIITIVLRVLLGWRLRRLAGRIISLAPLVPPQDKNLMHARIWHRRAWLESRGQAWNLWRSASCHGFLNNAEESLTQIDRSRGIAAPAAW